MKNKEMINQRYYQANRKRIRSSQRKYYLTHKSDWYKREERSFEKFLLSRFNRAKVNANKKGRTFDVKFPYLLALLRKKNYKCAATGVQMSKNYYSLNALSIDRIDSNKSYVKGNVQLVCKFYNIGKKNKSDTEARQLIKEIREASCV